MPITLNYKASNIAKAERASGKNFFEAISSLSKQPSMDNLLFLISAGGGTEEDFDELFKEGVEKVMMTIFEGINEAGFLGEKIDLKEMQAAMSSELNKAKETSPNTGDTVKA